MKLNYIFGPVPSWRLGKSLGIDLLSQPEKVCNFDCVYCQLGKTACCPDKRRQFIPASEIIRELSGLPATQIDYITFSGRGEPTLAAHLQETLTAVKKLRSERVAIITNAALMCDSRIREELLDFDFVIGKLDACFDRMLNSINRPMQKVKLSGISDGICDFRKHFKGKLAVQTMLLEENREFAAVFADIYRAILPDEIQLNTPLRQSPVQPLPAADVAKFADSLKSLLPESIAIKTVYDSEKPHVEPLSEPETLKRRGKI